MSVVALVALVALTLLASGCATGGSTGDINPVKLVITPVATPTETQPVPATPAPVTYTVKSGDTLSGIADLFGVTVDDIVRINNIADPNSLSEGQVLTIPGRPITTATPGPNALASPGQTAQPGTPGATATPVLPPPDVTPPLGPTTGGPPSGPAISPTGVRASF